MVTTFGRVEQKETGASFIVDHASISRSSGRQVDWDAFDDAYRVGVQPITVAAIAASDATSVTVAALPVELPKGAVLNFGAKKFAKLTAKALVGATTLAVEALATALAVNDVAKYFAPGSKRIIPKGTVVGDKLGNGLVGPRIVTTNPAMGILETDVVEGNRSDAMTGYGVIVGGAIYENLLPDASGSPKVLATAIKTELQANGTGFYFEQFKDSRAG